MNHTLRFVDTGYWLAIVNQDDAYHERAQALVPNLHGPFLTTEAILLELGDALARQRWRTLGIAMLKQIRADPDVEILPVDSALAVRGLDLYEARPDKERRLTDCISFVVMQDRGITEALAADQHFIQAGFQALLREA